MESKQIRVDKKGVLTPYAVDKMLVGLDLEGIEDKTLSYLQFFTSNIPTRNIFFMHIVPQLTYLTSIFEKKPDDEGSKINNTVAAVLADRIKNMYNPTDEKQKRDLIVRQGDPLQELLAQAKGIPADLLVIGQKSGAESHGITAKKLARKTECNALVVPEQAKPTCNHILVPVDFSECSGKALQTAFRIRKQLKKDTKITAIHIYTMPNLSTYKIDRPYSSFQNMIMSNISDGMTAFLKRFIPGHEEEIETDLVYKDMPGISRYIMQYADENDFDMIVIGAKGHSQVELLLLGSVTERLLHLNKKTPTLVVR